MWKFYEQLRKIREKRKISYQEVERHTRIPSGKLKNVEQGLEHLSVGEIEQLLAYYKVTVNKSMKIRRTGLARKLAMAMAAVAAAGAIIAYFAFDLNFLHPTAGDAGHGNLSESVPAAEDSLAEPTYPDELFADAEVSYGLDFAETQDEEPAASDEAIEPEADAEAAADGAMPQEQTTVIRFWGNIPYGAAELPHIGEQDSRPVLEIFPVEHLDDSSPAWLQGKNPDHYIINAGATDVWTPVTIEAYQQLKEDGIQVIGLGTAPEVYEPYVIQAGEKKIGFLPMAGLIHQASEIALPSRIGLARAYRNDEVTKAVQEAKSKVDYLFVLMHWGKKWTDQLNMAQKLIAPAIAKAGGDFIVGNHPYSSQEIMSIEGVPVFYALGHSVSDETSKTYYNYIVEVEFSSQVDRITLRVGKLVNGKLDFALDPEDREAVQASLSGKESLFEHFEIVY